MTRKNTHNLIKQSKKKTIVLKMVNIETKVRLYKTNMVKLKAKMMNKLIF